MSRHVRVLGVDAKTADTFSARFLGLMAKKGLAKGTGLLFERCRAIHTLFMRFPIDVVFLDSDMRVVKAVRKVRPWRPWVWGGWRARAALELDSRNGDCPEVAACGA